MVEHADVLGLTSGSIITCAREESQYRRELGCPVAVSAMVFVPDHRVSAGLLSGEQSLSEHEASLTSFMEVFCLGGGIEPVKQTETVNGVFPFSCC
jgi:hypothetical protein